MFRHLRLFSRPQRSGDPLGRGDLEEFVERGSDLLLRYGSLEQRDDLTAYHRVDRWDRLHLECGGDLLLGVHVHFREDPTSCVFSGKPLEDGRQLFARPAPGGPKIDHDRDGHRSIEDLLLESLRGDVDDDSWWGVGERCLRPALLLLVRRQGAEIHCSGEVGLAHQDIVAHSHTALLATTALLEDGDALFGDNDRMHVSARVDYGTRALVELAAAWLANPRGLTKGEDLAQAQGIPAKFLEGILRQLRQAGLVSSQRGAEGGYRLDRNPSDITIADVVRALDGPLAAVRDLRPEDVHYSGGADHLRDVWVALRSAMRDVLENTTLADVQSGDLPDRVRAYLAEPDAWRRR